ncbi:MAG: type IV pilus twitching motility protein PilT [Alphaproteobacteria bacterium]|nr:type IV pilus twitching motility protein PilT [Alphaproteobacteria bacterium]
MEISELLGFALESGASDLHLSGGSPPVLRIDGALRRIKAGPLSGDMIRTMIYTLMSETQRAQYEAELEHDFSISFGDNARFRVNVFSNKDGAAAVLRAIPTVIKTLKEIDAPAILGRLAELERGLVLVTGPTGSGKSTTLAAMIDHINATRGGHILTIEDPVEFVHTSREALINHREVGRDTHSFARALKSALREDPDVILVGEMRDQETISLALTAAETGHLVMGTLHTSSAVKTIDRIIDVFPAGDKEMVRAMLSTSLEAVVAQALLRKEGGGRVAVHEVMIATPAIRNLIRENKIPQIYSMLQMGQKFGMQTMADAVDALRMSGVIASEEAGRILEDADGANYEDAPKPVAATPQPQPAPVPNKKEGYSF